MRVAKTCAVWTFDEDYLLDMFSPTTSVKGDFG